MPKILVQDEEIYYQHQRGEPGRPPLVLVHGAGGDHMHWPAALRRLPGYSVYALDLPGHGRSGGAGRQAVGAYAEVIWGFAQALRLPRFVLGGHSMGGAVALEMALRHAAALAGLVLVGTGARLRVAPQILEGLLSDYAGTAALVTAWAHGPGTDARQLQAYTRRLRRVPAAVIYGDYLACDVFDRRPDVAQIGLPTLIVCGTADRMTPPKFSQWLKDQLPQAELAWAPDAGHMVMLEKPAVVAEAVTGFLARLPASA